MFASQAKMAAAIGVAAMLVAGNPLVGVASAATDPSGTGGDSAGPHNTYVDVGHTNSPLYLAISPTTTTINVDTVQAGLAALNANTGPANVVGISAYGMDAYELSQHLAEIRAQPGNHIVVLYGNPAHPNGILARLHLVKPATPTPDGTTNLAQVGMAYSLVDDAPSYFIGPDTPVAFLNAIATVLTTDKADYLDPFGSDPGAMVISRGDSPNSGTYALIVPSQKALTKLLSGIPFVGPTIATATKPLIDDMVERSYNRTLDPNDAANINVGPNQGGVFQPLQDWTSAPGRYLNDIQQGLNNVAHPPAVTPPVPDPEPEVTPESDPESFAPDSSGSETSARLQGDTDDGSPFEGDDSSAPRRNVVRNSPMARPGQQFADDVNKTVKQVNGDLQRTVHQVQTGLQQAGQNLQGAIRDTVNNLTKPHKPSTGNSGAAGSSGDSGSDNSGSDAGSGGGDK